MRIAHTHTVADLGAGERAATAAKELNLARTNVRVLVLLLLFVNTIRNDDSQ